MESDFCNNAPFQVRSWPREGNCILRIPRSTGKIYEPRSFNRESVGRGRSEGKGSPHTDVKHYRAELRNLFTICSPTRRTTGEKSSPPMAGSARRMGCNSGSVSLLTNWTTGLPDGRWTHESMTAPKTINE